MSLVRPPSDAVHRRSARVKSVISRRTHSTLSRSSKSNARNNTTRSRSRSRSTASEYEDDDMTTLDLGAEEDEILSCFLDEPFDNGFLVERVVQDSLRASEEREQCELRREKVAHEEEHDALQAQQALAQGDQTDIEYSDNTKLVQQVPKQTVGSFDESKYEAGDSNRVSIDEPMLQKNHVNQTETRMGKNYDFTDMAMSRDGHDTTDVGLDRAELLVFHRDRSRPASDIVHQNRKERLFEPTVTFGWFDIVIGILAISVFFVDIATDIELAVHYFREEMWMYAGVTTGLIIWPSIVTTTLGLHWYIIDYNKEMDIVDKIKKAKKKAFVTPRYVWFLRFAFTLLQMGPVFRIMAYLYYGHMSKNKKLTEKQRNRYYHFMLYEDVDSCLLRLFESFLESAPQLSWQLYIALVLKETGDDIGTSFRAIALLSSWGSLAISLVSYHRSLRNSNDEKAKMSWVSVPFYFVWRASEIGGRVLCIATFASVFQLWVFGPLLFHWLFMSGWLIAQKTSFYKNMCHERIFNIICGYVMIFCFLNLREGFTRFRFLLFYFIMYLENFFMLAFWFHFSPDLGKWYHLWGFTVILILFVLHVIFQLLYYRFFHPTKKIRLCLPCDAYVVYESLCSDIESAVPELVEPPDTPSANEVPVPNITVMNPAFNNAQKRRSRHVEHKNVEPIEEEPLDIGPKVTTV